MDWTQGGNSKIGLFWATSMNNLIFDKYQNKICKMIFIETNLITIFNGRGIFCHCNMDMIVFDR